MDIKTPPKTHAYAYHICGALYNGSCAMATKPIKFLELHHTMTQFLIIVVILIQRVANKRLGILEFSQNMACNIWPSDQQELWNLLVPFIYEQWNTFLNYTITYVLF